MILVNSDEDAKLLLFCELSDLKLDLEVLLLANDIDQQFFDSFLDLFFEVLFFVYIRWDWLLWLEWESHRRMADSLAFEIGFDELLI